MASSTRREDEHKGLELSAPSAHSMAAGRAPCRPALTSPRWSAALAGETSGLQLDAARSHVENSCEGLSMPSQLTEPQSSLVTRAGGKGRRESAAIPHGPFQPGRSTGQSGELLQPRLMAPAPLGSCPSLSPPQIQRTHSLGSARKQSNTGERAQAPALSTGSKEAGEGWISSCPSTQAHRASCPLSEHRFAPSPGNPELLFSRPSRGA